MPTAFSGSRSTNPGKAARQVLVVRQGPPRDLLLAIGALQTIRAAHPRAKLTLIASPATEAFAALCPFIDAVITDLEHEDRRRRTDRLAELRQTAFDMIYDLDGDLRSTELFRSLKPRLGVQPPWSGPAQGAAFPSPAARLDSPEIERFAAQLEAAGAIQPGTSMRPDFGWLRPVLGDPPRLTPGYFNIHGDFAILALSAEPETSPLYWPLPELVRLCRHLAQAQVTPVLAGPPEAGPLAQSIEMEVRAAKNIAARCDTSQLIALCERAAVVIGPDSAAIQAAGVLNTNCLFLRAARETSRRQDAPLTARRIDLIGDTLSALGGEKVWHVLSRWNLFQDARAS